MNLQGGGGIEHHHLLCLSLSCLQCSTSSFHVVDVVIVYVYIVVTVVSPPVLQQPGVQ